MKLTKLPNMPEPFGYQIDDIDLATLKKQELYELAELCKKHLVITFKDQHITKERFALICYTWGEPHKYTNVENDFIDPETRGDLERMSFPHLPGLGRVTGIRNAEGKRTGMFADGQLDWHSNQPGTKNPKCVVGLQGVEGTKGTQTQFIEGVTTYNNLSAADKAVVDSLISVYGFKYDAVGPGAAYSQQEIVKINQGAEGFEKPLVAVSPGGYRGINFCYTTIKGFKGKTEQENKELFDWLHKVVFVPELMYTHDWDDGDVLFMDQIVTLHRRPTVDCSKRLLHRMAFDFSRVGN